jgi:hypothetical protein
MNNLLLKISFFRFNIQQFWTTCYLRNLSEQILTWISYYPLNWTESFECLFFFTNQIKIYFIFIFRVSLFQDNYPLCSHVWRWVSQQASGLRWTKMENVPVWRRKGQEVQRYIVVCELVSFWWFDFIVKSIIFFVHPYWSFFFRILVIMLQRHFLVLMKFQKQYCSSIYEILKHKLLW